MLTITSTKIKKSTTQSNNNQHTQVRYTTPTAGIARRALLLVSFLLLGLGNVWGQEIWTNNGTLGDINWSGDYRFAPQSNTTGEECYAVPQDVWERMKTEVFYATIKGDAPLIRITTGWWSANLTSDDIQSGNELLANNGDGTYTLTVNLASNPDLVSLLDAQHLLFTGGGYSVEELYFAEDDEFLGEANYPNDPTAKGEGSEEISKSESSVSFTLAKAQEAPTVVKYARIVLCDASGNAIGNQSMLNVTYNGKEAEKAGKNDKNGVYVYNGGDDLILSNIKITLNAGVGEMNKYSIKCLLSTNAVNPDNIDNEGIVTKEPNWDYEYTYRFIYPVLTKTRYKTLVANGNDTWTPHLLGNWFELAGDCNVGRTELANKLYVRWYLTDLKGDVITDNFGSWNNGGYSEAGGKSSYYRYTFTAGGLDGGNQFNRDGTGTDYNPTFTLPNGYDYNNVRLVCVATTLTEGYPTNRWEADPDEIQVKYVYTLMKQGDLKPFAHYQGEAYRYLMEENQPDEANKYKYANYGDGVPNQYTWDVSTNNYSTTTTSENIRQDAHTVDYYYYVEKGKSVSLLLPNQDYANIAKDSYNGNDLKGNGNEPKAYFRWYDYKTDMHSSYLTATKEEQLHSKKMYDNELEHIYEDNSSNMAKSRGLFAIRLSNSPCEDVVGVNFTAPDGFSEEIQIACDVSRYMDGMDESFTYLVHEPTLSIRYLFHILPAETIAAKIADKANANSDTKKGLEAVEEKIINNGKPTILEDEGRTVVSTNKGVGEFALRTQLSDLGHYYLYDTSNELQPAKSLWWYVYYKDAEGNWWKHLVPRAEYRDRDGNVVKKDGNDFYRTQTYQAKYSFTDRSWSIWENSNGTNKIEVSQKGDFQENWEKYENNTWKKETAVKFPNGFGVNSRVQMVACVSADDNEEPGENIMPIIWTELEFIDAKPLTINEVNGSERSPGNMKTEHGEPDAILDFNDYSLYGLKRPTSSYENYATLPLQFANAQYGYCFPQLYGLCATMKGISYWEGFGFAPMHGDYTLLKSMNMPNISMDTTTDNFDQHSFIANWVNSSSDGALYDVTHERAHPRNPDDNKNGNPTNTDDYGSFLYVDAADEARTIASLEFKAKLCYGAKIYYTAYVASSTGQTVPKDQPVQKFSQDLEEYNKYKTPQTPPMLRFRVSTKNEQGERVPVVTFVTGNIKEEVNYSKANSFQEALWYQVYGYTTIPSELNELLDGEEHHFYVEIDNYCDNTDGADYCIDQIAFYTTNASLLVKQTVNKKCDDKAIDLNIYVSKEDIDNNDVKKLYWRIYETGKNGDKALTDPKIYNNGEKSYGEVEITEFDSEKTPYETTFNDSDATSGYFKVEKGANDVYYFSLTKGSFVLEEGREYFISVYELDQDPEEGKFEWGKRSSPCSVYSEFFVPKAMYVSAVNEAGDEVTEIEMDCSGTKARVDLKMVLYLPDENEEDGFKRYEGVHFDYFIGTKQEFIDYHINHNNVDIYLRAALTHFRERHDNADDAINFEDKKFKKTYTIDDLPKIESEYKVTDDYVNGYYEVIFEAVKAGLLHLSCSEDVNLMIDDKHSTVVVLPVDDWVEDKYPICSPLAFTFDVEPSKGAPQLALGFDDVEYPKDYVRVVRVGKKQLSNMQKADGGFMLHIPIHSFSGRDETESSSIVFESPDLVLSETTDPTKDTDIVVAALQGEVTEGVTSRPIVNDTHQYLAIKFKKEEEFTFHEGYEYELHTRYYDIADNDEDNNPNGSACIGDLWLIIKVVPEYVTWNDGGSVTENSNRNDNWNNDANWSRSKKGELYKTNTNNYEDNSEIFGENYEGTPATFVPMKFTYVTIPSGNRAPKLIELKRGTEQNVNMGIYTNIGETATDNIQYDLMVRYTEEYCLGHGNIASSTKYIYDCEKFYGNWAKEIYFKPGAELVHQHYLTYEKVWVEKLLTANTWTLMSTPLQNTYAGDMYVPYSTDATKNGRQETEAFQDITFGTGYSRTLYPIYQRSWAQAGSTVYTSTDDMYRSNYSANLSGTVSSTFTLWSHTYNDVMVDYSTWKGFAVRAHKKEQSDLALLRLPKNDLNFSYYNWKDDPGMSNKIDRPKYGKLFTDSDNAPDTRYLTYGVVYDYGTTTEGEKERTAGDGKVTESLNVVQSAQGYQLVGNPYLCSIDMATFLTENIEQDKIEPESGYWTYENNFVKVYTQGHIKPLQSFFVKAKNGANEFVFTSDMMIDGNTNPISSQAPAMRMTATNNRGKSTATVLLGDEAKTVETLFDSNLDDVPMVYTVAEGQAVSINQLAELDKPIAFGVTCTASDDPVTVTFSDIAQLTTDDVFVVDAVTGEQTPVSEGNSISVQPNDYGRYFLLAGAANIGNKADVQKGIIVSIRDRAVTVTSGEALTLVRATLLDGITAYQYTGGDTTASFTLTPGVYIVYAENAAGEQQTVKVIVK